MIKKFKKYLQKPPLAKEGEINHVAIDRFTFVHFFIGIAYGLLGFEFWLAFLLALAWEIIENPLKFNFPVVFPRGTADTIQNAIFDIAAVMLGWALIVRFII